MNLIPTQIYPKNSYKMPFFALALILLLMASAFAANISSVQAHTPAWNIPTYAFINVSPSPIGVNQEATVAMWLSAFPPTASGAGGDRWENMTITITKPDGTVENRGPYTSDPVGSVYFQYTPTQTGTYSFQMKYPGQTLTGGKDPYPGAVAFIGDYFQPSTSNKATLVVQNIQVAAYPSWPLPTGYWTRPIEAENRDWWSISGNWLMGGSNNAAGAGRVNYYSSAPKTAHVLWMKSLEMGGIVGGEYGDNPYYEGLSYELKANPMIILNGVLYYPQYASSTGRGNFNAVDLRTGETLWTQNGTGNGKQVRIQMAGGGALGGFWTGYPRLTLGQVYAYDSPNQHGAIPYIWSIGGTSGTTRWDMYDASTGAWILSLENASSGTTTFSADGSILVYMLDATRSRLTLWNSSLAIPLPGNVSTDAWQWRPPPGATLDWRNGLQWNVSIPGVPGQGISKVGDGVVYTRAVLQTAPTTIVSDVAYDASTGNRLWGPTNRTYPIATIGSGAGGPSVGPMGSGVFTEYTRETLSWNGYDVKTGNKLWTTDPYSSAWAMYAMQGSPGGATIAYDKLFTGGYDGMVTAFDVKTGKKLWEYSTGNAGYESPYGSYPVYGSGFTIANGIVYVPTGEHSPTKPLIRGEAIHAIDATTGQGLWKMLGWFEYPAIADGYLVTFDGSTNQIVCFGKGPTSTEVSVTKSQISKGEVVGIVGKVEDQTPQQQGTPAIADTNMTEWMLYKNFQKPAPQNINGVPVKLTAIRSDGTQIDLGYTVSDANGIFRFQWTPPSQDLFEIVANFTGSDAYWGSDSATTLMVGPAPSAAVITPIPTQTIAPTVTATQTQSPSPPPSTAPQPTGGVPMTTYVAIAAVIVIALIVAAAAVLRRRK